MSENYMMRYAPQIAGKLILRAAYEALAEECAELAQASLKLCRIISGENPTPTSVNTAVDKIAEEMQDVVSCMVVCTTSVGVPPEKALSDIVEDVKHYSKWKRWAYRLRLLEDRGD